MGSENSEGTETIDVALGDHWFSSNVHVVFTDMVILLKLQHRDRLGDFLNNLDNCLENPYSKTVCSRNWNFSVSHSYSETCNSVVTSRRSEFVISTIASKITAQTGRTRTWGVPMIITPIAILVLLFQVVSGNAPLVKPSSKTDSVSNLYSKSTKTAIKLSN